MAYKNHEIIDLSQDIYQGQPVFVGHPETWRWTNMTHEESAASGRFKSEMSYYSGIIQFCEHGPTHVDSVSHLDPSPDAPHIDEMSFDNFYSRGIAIDFENVEDNSYINADDVKRRLDHYNYEIKPGRYPALHLRALQAPPPDASLHHGLRRLDARCGRVRLWRMRGHHVATDAPSMDMASSPDYPCHLVCRELGRINTETCATSSWWWARSSSTSGFRSRSVADRARRSGRSPC